MCDICVTKIIKNTYWNKRKSIRGVRNIPRGYETRNYSCEIYREIKWVYLNRISQVTR